MSTTSEEYLISPENHSEKSLTPEDSLTAKLDNMLQSSDEIIVENTNFFKASSNELTEVDDVADLPRTDMVPRLDFEGNKRKKYKSGESYTSLGTVVRHETPKVRGVRKSQVIKLQRPLSAQSRSQSSRGKQRGNEKELKTCLKRISSRHPEYVKMIKNNKSDFENYFYYKVEGFKKILENNIGLGVNLNKERAKVRNKEKDRKREEIRAKLQEEELERIRTSNVKFEENCRSRLKSLVETTLKKYQTVKMVEDCKIAKEAEQQKLKEKQIIIENIRSYYDNKIQIFKEKLNERKAYKTLFDYEHKVIFSEAEKLRKTQQKLKHQKNLNILKKQAEDIEIESKNEENLISKKIIKLYKNSTKSLKQKNNFAI